MIDQASFLPTRRGFFVLGLLGAESDLVYSMVKSKHGGAARWIPSDREVATSFDRLEDATKALVTYPCDNNMEEVGIFFCDPTGEREIHLVSIESFRTNQPVVMRNGNSYYNEYGNWRSLDGDTRVVSVYDIGSYQRTLGWLKNLEFVPVSVTHKTAYRRIV